jgi:hypothetical protein
MRAPGTGIGGYRPVTAEGIVDDPSFLTGAAGIALSLQAAVSNAEPAWHRVNGPPGAAIGAGIGGRSAFTWLPYTISCLATGDESRMVRARRSLCREYLR